MSRTKKDDLPALPFYVGDWMKCPEVRVCSLAARGLWFDMLCLMWESNKRGFLVNPIGVKYEPENVARIVGENPGLVKQLLNELETNGVYSKDENGVIYCRRMVKDEDIRQKRRVAGKRGGNPILVKQKDKQTSENENEKKREKREGRRGRKKHVFIPPSREESDEFCRANNFGHLAEKIYRYYSEADPPWTDSRGQPIRSWRQKYRGVWFRDENRDQRQPASTNMYRELSDHD